MSLYEQYHQQQAAHANNANNANASKQQRVVADGWGVSGSVFCADSSLRFIYESQAHIPTPGSTAAAISSLASGDFGADQKTNDFHHANANGPTSMPTPTLAYDKLTNGQHPSLYHQHMQFKPVETVASSRGADGVDLFEAEIARACVAVTKQAPSLPHSFRECSVCLTQNAYAQIGVCGHTFHSKCFLRWFRTNRSCPLCRGPVDKVQCAPVLSVQDELEALMAEMDDHESLSGDGGESDPLMENPDLISLLGGDFDDADMDMMPLDDVLEKHDENDDVSMEVEEDDVTVPEPVATFGMQLEMLSTPPQPPQFAPSSTMPNYWNVLNQGLTLPPVMATPIVSTPVVNPHRMVHIAPKPDGHVPMPHTHTHAQHTHHASHLYGHVAPSHPFASTARATSPALSVAGSVASLAESSAAAPRVVSCRCTGGCRNGRCACVKEGGMCGAACRCTSCKNPFLMVKAAGADIDALLQDSCFMHNVSKTRDMVVRMQEPVDVPCCDRQIKVIDCVQGYECAPCRRTFDFSWCMNKLLDHDKTPRNHCAICKRCCDHRDVHCDDCGRCYFAGVAASLPCPCKESSRKRRDHQHHHHDASTTKEDAVADEDEKDGECSIM